MCPIPVMVFAIFLKKSNFLRERKRKGEKERKREEDRGRERKREKEREGEKERKDREREREKEIFSNLNERGCGKERCELLFLL